MRLKKKLVEKVETIFQQGIFHERMGKEVEVKRSGSEEEKR